MSVSSGRFSLIILLLFSSPLISLFLSLLNILFLFFFKFTLFIHYGCKIIDLSGDNNDRSLNIKKNLSLFFPTCYFFFSQFLFSMLEVRYFIIVAYLFMIKSEGLKNYVELLSIWVGFIDIEFHYQGSQAIVEELGCYLGLCQFCQGRILISCLEGRGQATSLLKTMLGLGQGPAMSVFGIQYA